MPHPNLKLAVLVPEKFAMFPVWSSDHRGLPRRKHIKNLLVYCRCHGAEEGPPNAAHFAGLNVRAIPMPADIVAGVGAGSPGQDRVAPGSTLHAKTLHFQLIGESYAEVARPFGQLNIRGGPDRLKRA
jgi:hypothetical protein